MSNLIVCLQKYIVSVVFAAMSGLVSIVFNICGLFVVVSSGCISIVCIMALDILNILMQRLRHINNRVKYNFNEIYNTKIIDGTHFWSFISEILEHQRWYCVCLYTKHRESTRIKEYTTFH